MMELWRLLIWCCFSLQPSFLIHAKIRDYSLVRSSEENLHQSSRYFILYSFQQISRIIPNEETMQHLLNHERLLSDYLRKLTDSAMMKEEFPVVSIDHLPRLPIAFIEQHYPHHQQTTASITSHASRLQALVQCILILSPPSFFWKENHRVFSHMFNPSLQYVIGKPDKLLLAYRRQMMDVPPIFAWYSLKEFQILEDDYEAGIGSSSHYTKIPKFWFNQLQEDLRLFLQSNGNIVVLYTGKASLMTHARMCYFNLTFIANPHHSPSSPAVNKQRRALRQWDFEDHTPDEDASAIGDKVVSFSETVLLDGHPYDRSGQKNWIVLESLQDNRLYFIQSINPFHLLAHVSTDPNHIGTLQVIYEMKEEIPLPWIPLYGLPLRGGTPTLLVHNLTRFHHLYRSHCHLQHSFHHHTHSYQQGNHSHLSQEVEKDCSSLPPDSLYLAFFHTVSQLKPPIRTYFMGAITFCPQFPFPIYAMSPHPILLEEYYNNTEIDPGKIDHVVFPIGLFQFPDDRDSVWITFGYEDKHGAIAKYDLYELLRSLEVVNANCTIV